MKKFLSISLFTLGLFFVANFGASTASDPKPTNSNDASMSVKKTLDKAEKNPDGSYSVEYTIKVKNTGKENIKDLKIEDDLNKAFKNYPFEIVYKSVTNATANEGYNGKSNVSLINSGKDLNVGGEITVVLKAKFNPGKDKGPFENFANASGKLDDGKDVVVKPEPPAPTPIKEPIETPDPGKTPNPLPPEQEKDLTQRKFVLYIVDASTGKILKEIKQGDTINLDELPTKNISIKIDVVPGTKGSLKIVDNKSGTTNVENNAPYGVVGNNKDLYNPWQYELGDQSISITTYTEKNTKGTIINQETFNFKLIGTQDSAPKGDNFTNESDSVVFEFPEEEEEKEATPTPIPEEQPKEEKIPLAIVTEKEETSEELPPRVLAETGISLTETFIIGLIVIFVVLELNLFNIEDRLAMNLFAAIKRRFSNKDEK